MSVRTLGATVLVTTALVLTGCSGDTDTKADEPEVSATPTPTPTPTPSPTPTEEPSEPAPEPKMFPKGYPKVVKVASLPDQVKSWYEGDYTKAVAIAPGVWAPLPPGATVEDAATAGVVDGFCASIKAYERKFTPGESHGGACW